MKQNFGTFLFWNFGTNWSKLELAGTFKYWSPSPLSASVTLKVLHCCGCECGPTMNNSFQMLLKAKLETFHSGDFTGFHEEFLGDVDFVWNMNEDLWLIQTWQAFKEVWDDMFVWILLRRIMFVRMRTWYVWMKLIFEHFVNRGWITWEILEGLVARFPFKGKDANSRLQDSSFDFFW